MDESWRMRMGMPSVAARRSTDRPLPRSVFASAAAVEGQPLDAADFADVFGGPPRSFLPRQSSSGSSTSFSDDMFVSSAENGGRILPDFRIPAKNEGFYSDIFGSDDEFQRRSRERSGANSKAKSKSNSSSVLSSEELSPLRPVVCDDVALSSFASKLRPLNVPCRWDSSTMKPAANVDENTKASYFGFTRKVLSPETISIEPCSFRSVKLSTDDVELVNSPSSDVSSLCQEQEATSRIHDGVLPGKEMGVLEQEEFDDVMGSYVIEINSDHREGTCEEVNLEEAIAWAKEKFQSHCASEQELSMLPGDHNEQSTEMDEGRNNADEYSQRDEHKLIQAPEGEDRAWIAEDEKKHSEKDTEMEVLDENVRLWSAGKESNIRMLLSTLHHILWDNSGWYALPLTSLIESSQVKKAYQKARLCLHPDKLQQRAATPAQKYLAEKAFSILQDAWDLFISQDVFII